MSKTVKIILISLAALVILLLVGKSAGLFGNKGNFKEVEIEKVTLKDIVEKVSATGKIQPEVEVKISPDVSGEIVELLIKEGDRVSKGDLLIKIKPDIYKSILARS